MAEERDLKAMAAGVAEIEAWRRRIDRIDEQLMQLLNSRSACAVEIGKIKRARDLPIYSPEREAWILDRVMRENPGPLDPTAVRRVFERIIDEGRRLERISMTGPPEDAALRSASPVPPVRQDDGGSPEPPGGHPIRPNGERPAAEARDERVDKE